IGGNDIGFANIVTDLVLHDRGNSLPQPALLSNLPGLYTQLDDKLVRTFGSKLDSSHVLITEYPDITHDGNGRTAPAILDDIAPGMSIDSTELDWARANVIEPLNDQVRQAAQAHHWTFVGGLSSLFSTHGYGADDPYASNAIPARIRWVRTADESRN